MTDTRRGSPARDGHPSFAVRVRLSIRMLIPRGRRKEARSILSAMSSRIRLEEGCLSCRLYQDAVGGEALMFEEIWKDEKHLQKHLRSDEFRNVLLVVEMASKAPEIHFDRIAQSTGIESIKHIGKRSDMQPGADGQSV